MMTIPHHPPALADAMTLLRLIADPSAAKAILDGLAAAQAANLAELEKRRAQMQAEFDAREKALDAREEALADAEAVLATRLRRLDEALAGVP